MKVTPTEIAGVCVIELEPHFDERGFFARLFCPEELAREELSFASTQINLSRNLARHTLRGMHFQDAPHAEAKIVRVVQGAIFDVVVDLRPTSATHHLWIGRVLNAERGDALLIPEGCAHGFLTLEPNSDVLYQMSRLYKPGQARGFRFDDPRIGIDWPHPPAVIAAADAAWPSL